ILKIKREWRAGDKITIDFPMRARVSFPIETAPEYFAFEKGPLVLAMTERFNNTGDGWSYVSPILRKEPEKTGGASGHLGARSAECNSAIQSRSCGRTLRYFPEATVDLAQVALKDPAGQARIGWRTAGIARFDIWGKIVTGTVPITLVPFSDAGLEAEPYIA